MVAVGTVVSDGPTDKAYRRVIGLQVDGCCVSVDSIDWVRTKLQRPAFAMSQHSIHQTLFSVCHVRRLFPAPVNEYAGFIQNKKYSKFCPRSVIVDSIVDCTCLIHPPSGAEC